MPGTGPVASRSCSAALVAWRGLAGVLVGADPAPEWRWPVWQRRVVYAVLGVATPVLCAASLASLWSLDGLIGLVDRPGPKQVSFALGAFSPGRAVPPGFVRDVISRDSAVHAVGVFPGGWLAPGGPLLVVLGVLVALAVVAPLPLAARYPLLGWRIGWLGLLLVPLAGIRWSGVGASWWAGWPWDPVQVLVLVVVFCVAGVRHPRAVLWWMWALTLIPWWLRAGHDRPGVLACALGSVAFTVAAVAADAMGARRRARQALAEQAGRTELEQARRAVLVERAKIARELHDVVAHHMSLIAVRAETAPYRLAGLPGPVAEEFGSLSEAAREALADMRRLLGVLRDDQPASRSPQPQLADLPVLIDTARAAGVPVELSAAPALAPVPAGVGVCVYRIVQESLSNASRHAPGAAVTVAVDQGGGAVLLRVANGPARPAGRPGNGHGPGQGLAGMRERVALLGGSLSAGPSPDGGFVVAAVLPAGQAA
jgi:signal transduction histidine kinase